MLAAWICYKASTIHTFKPFLILPTSSNANKHLFPMLIRNCVPGCVTYMLKMHSQMALLWLQVRVWRDGPKSYSNCIWMAMKAFSRWSLILPLLDNTRVLVDQISFTMLHKPCNNC